MALFATITCSAEEVKETTSVIDFSKMGLSESTTNLKNLVCGNCVLSFFSDSATQSNRYEKSCVRFYKRGKLTITSSETLNRVVFTFGTSKVKSFQCSNGSFDISSLTWTGNDSTLTITNTGDACWISTMTVTTRNIPKTTTSVTFENGMNGKTIEFEQGESFSGYKATLAPETAGTLTYKSSNSSVASVDASTGDVTLGTQLGTTTITASYAGDYYNMPSSAYYEIRQNAKKVEGTIVFDRLKKSFDNVPSYSDSEKLKNQTVVVVDTSGVKYNFTLTCGGKKQVSEGILQLHSGDGVLTSPTFESFTEGYTAKITYHSGGNDGLKLNSNNGKSTNNVNQNSGTESNGLGSLLTIKIPNNEAFSVKAYNNVYISNITITPNPLRTDTIDEGVDDTIDLANDVNVTLKRTLSNEYWNTFCVPFDISSDKAKAVFGDSVRLREFTGTMQGSVMIFKNATSIEAGKPYLMRPDYMVVDPTFTGVDIEKTTPDTVFSTGGYGFAGVFTPMTIATDGTNVFISTTGVLKKPTKTGNRMKGMRAFIILPNAEAAKATSITLEDDEAQAITDVTARAKADGAFYSINGQKLGYDKPAEKGIYIINGKKHIIR